MLVTKPKRFIVIVKDCGTTKKKYEETGKSAASDDSMMKQVLSRVINTFWIITYIFHLLLYEVMTDTVETENPISAHSWCLHKWVSVCLPVAKWRYEVEAAVHSVVHYVSSVQPTLIVEVALKLIVNVLDDGLKTDRRDTNNT